MLSLKTVDKDKPEQKVAKVYGVSHVTVHACKKKEVKLKSGILPEPKMETWRKEGRKERKMMKKWKYNKGRNAHYDCTSFYQEKSWYFHNIFSEWKHNFAASTD